MPDPIVPDLTGEKSREKEAATEGIVARDAVTEFAGKPVPGESGVADRDDDAAIDDPSDTAPVDGVCAAHALRSGACAGQRCRLGGRGSRRGEPAGAGGD